MSEVKIKIKITKNGYLNILRKSKMKFQHCPHQYDDCGDWCSLFGEPQHVSDGHDVYLQLCRTGLLSIKEELVDERE